jgi:hypothetical protein
MVARVDKDFANQVERLLRSGSDQDILRIYFDVITRRMPGDLLAQWEITFGGAILQRQGAVVEQHTLARFSELLDWEDIWGGQSTAKGDNIGLLS